MTPPPAPTLDFIMQAEAKQEVYREARAKRRELLREAGFDIPEMVGRTIKGEDG